MSQGYYVNQLLQLIGDYRLEDRHPNEISPIVLMAQHGILSEGMAKAYLMMIQPLVDATDPHPNFLPRPPTEGELYAEGRPDIEVGNVAEGEMPRCGLRIRNRIPHVLAAGAPGSGKTTLARVIIQQVEDLNVQEEQANQPDHN